MKRLLVSVAFLMAMVLALSTPAQAQFGYYGKNKAWPEKMDGYYQSPHFNFFHGMDLTNPSLKKAFEDVVAELERDYDKLSVVANHQLKTKPNVVVYRTHTGFESSYILDYEFMPEGVGAYAYSPRNHLVVKPDFLPTLNRTIFIHELVHIFQFEVLNLSLVERVMQSEPIALWQIEGMADYYANRFRPYTRDDIRRMEQRGVAVNPEKDLPSIFALQSGQGNEYSMGAMVFMFIEGIAPKYGLDGQKAVDDFSWNSLRQRRTGIKDRIADLTNGEINSLEAFDRAHRDYWRELGKKWQSKARPYEENEFFRGRFMLEKFPFPVTSPVLSKDGNEVAFITFDRKYGIVVAKAKTTPRDLPPYVKTKDRKKQKRFGPFQISGEPSPFSGIQVLTKYLPPKHYEEISAQLLSLWPFNGYDLDWWQDADWVSRLKTAQAKLDSIKKELSELKPKDSPKAKLAEKLSVEKAIIEIRQEKGKSKIAFFARKNRDHALFIIDSNKGDMLREVQVPFDQAVTPVFSPDGKTVYFSASKDIQRDLYALNLETGESRNLTNGGQFNSAPAVSPDGTKLAYIAFVGDFQKMFVLDIASGAKTQLTFNRTNENSPSWSEDGKTISYTSDEPQGDPDRIWNLYSLSLDTKIASQWTDFYGGVFTPRYVPGETNRVYYVGYWQYDQFRSYIYSNFEMFDALLKKPYREFVVTDKNESMQYSFHPADLDIRPLDENQVLNPDKQPRKWDVSGESAFGGYGTYYGAFSYSRFQASDILNLRSHYFVYMQRGGFTDGARMMDYVYVNRASRWAWGFGLQSERMPMSWQLYDVQKRYPKQLCLEKECDSQFALNDIVYEQNGFQLLVQYPFTKWTRLELGLLGQQRKFDFLSGITAADIGWIEQDYPGYLSQNDIAVMRYFDQSNGTSMRTSAAFVHDTVMYSYNTMGPAYGKAIRVGIDAAPGFAGMSGYVSAYADARLYQRVTSGSLFALRFLGQTSNRPNGDFLYLGGTDTLRAYPYASVLGNNILYGSAEFRLPLVDAIYLLGGIGLGPIRGLVFGDYGIAEFTNSGIPAQRAWSFGFGMNMGPFNVVWAKRKIDEQPRHWRFDFYLGQNF